MRRTRQAYVRNERPINYRKHLVRERNLSELDRAVLEASKRSQTDFKFFCEALLGVRVHSGQLTIVDLMNVKDYGVLAAANGWGKTFFYAALMLWATYTKQWAPIWWQQYKAVVLGPELAQALITHNEIEKLRNHRHDAQFWREESGGDGKKHKMLIANLLQPFNTANHHVAFQWKHNGSQLFFESAKEKASSIEGWAINLLIFDEARLELHLKEIVDEVILARGVRAPDMRILLGSTPKSSSYEFREYYMRGERGDELWWSKAGKIEENIFNSKAQVDKIRRAINDPRVERQVLAGEFVEDPESYFVTERVLSCMNEQEPAPTDFDKWEGKALGGHQYVGGIDVAVAEGGDYSVVTIWDITTVEGFPPCRVVYEKVFPKGTSVTNVVQYCDILIQEFSCTFGYDATGPLGVEFGHQVSHNAGWYFPVKFGGYSEAGKSVPKLDALANFKYLINNRLWSSPNLDGLKAEILSYKVDDKELKKDRLMAQVYAAWVAKDYLGQQMEGFSFADMAEVYGEAGPFQGYTPAPNMSRARQELLMAVAATKQQDEARRIAEELGRNN